MGVEPLPQKLGWVIVFLGSYPATQSHVWARMGLWLKNRNAIPREPLLAVDPACYDMVDHQTLGLANSLFLDF